ncbi:MAG: lactonase family protein [Planctomycetaceae bacterium]
MTYRIALLLVLGFFAAISVPSADAAEHRIYIGTYTEPDSISDGIYTCLFNDETGSLSAPELAVKADNPSFLAIHPNGRVLFAVNELNEFRGEKSGAVSAFRIDPQSGKLTFINQQSTSGGAPCHCNIDGTGKFLLVANYVGGNVAVFPIEEDGALGEHSCVINHEGSSVNARRQEAPHAHSINLSSDNRFAYVADLGIDRIMIYRFDAKSGVLEANSPAFAEVAAGGGPRHFAIHPSGEFAYTNNEITSSATAFTRDTESGGLTPVQTLSTLPDQHEGGNSTAECLVDPSGRFLYVSNRGNDSIAVFAIDQQSGKLSTVEIEPTQGQAPRNFFIMPDGHWLLAENQSSDSVVVFSVNQQFGTLTATDHRIKVGRPVCIRILN